MESLPTSVERREKEDEKEDHQKWHEQQRNRGVAFGSSLLFELPYRMMTWVSHAITIAYTDNVDAFAMGTFALPFFRSACLFEGIYVAVSSSKQMAKKKAEKSSRKAKKTTAKRRVIKEKEVAPLAAAPATPQLAAKSPSDVHSPYR